MENGANLLSIPSDHGVDRVILNTNVKVGDVVVHVQTEEVKPKGLIVTYVLYEGQVIDRVERSYTKFGSKPNIRELIHKVADAQHNKKIGSVREIWAQFSTTVGHSGRAPKRASLRPAAMSSQSDSDRALELFELGLTLYKEEPLKAHAAWKEAVGLDPNNKVYRTNLKRLEDLSQGVMVNDKKSGCFSACFKPPAKLRLIKTG